jgi:hypothetical protein
MNDETAPEPAPTPSSPVSGECLPTKRRRGGSTKVGMALRRVQGKGIGGRPRGSKNKHVIEREKKIADGLRALEILEEARARGAIDEIEAAKQQGRKLMKEIAFDFARLFAGLAAFYQPFPGWKQDENGKVVNANPNFNEQKFKEYAVLARDTAIAAAPFESPKFSAVMVGATVVNKVEVSGGMPDDFSAPAAVPAQALPPLTIVEAEDDYVAPAA